MNIMKTKPGYSGHTDMKKIIPQKKKNMKYEYEKRSFMFLGTNMKYEAPSSFKKNMKYKI